MFHPDDVWKIVSFVAFICAGLVGHFDMLPASLRPIEPWLVFIGFVGALVQAWRTQPPQGVK